MKKIYKEPKEIVIELGMESQLLDTSVQGGYDDKGDNGNYGGSKDEESMESSASHSLIWDTEW